MPKARQLAIITALGVLAFALRALYAGQDANWDLQNYHRHAAYALLHWRYPLDMAPGAFQGYFNALSYLPAYAFQSLPPKLAAVALAPAWRLKAPDAILLDAEGQDVGHHFAGPSWQAKDGSVVVGEVVASSPSSAGSIPWLLLRAKSHTGHGTFASVTYITRTGTIGGLAPSAGCDQAHINAETHVASSASYTFFSDPTAP